MPACMFSTTTNYTSTQEHFQHTDVRQADGHNTTNNQLCSHM